jgi:hypothetical protein
LLRSQGPTRRRLAKIEPANLSTLRYKHRAGKKKKHRKNCAIFSSKWIERKVRDLSKIVLKKEHFFEKKQNFGGGFRCSALWIKSLRIVIGIYGFRAKNLSKVVLDKSISQKKNSH